MNGNIETKTFRLIDLNDPFFDSLKEDYPGFENWYSKKSNEIARVLYNSDGGLDAFLYLKHENGPITDVIPQLDEGNWLKVGTMKVNPHGTRLGERFIKKIFDYAIVNGIEKIYVTVFEKHDKLVDTFLKYGFVKSAVKPSFTGEELVLTKKMKEVKDDNLLSYPVIRTRRRDKHLLAIKPGYHTNLFPDSILRNERIDIIKDVSHTNSIHKIYIAKMKGLSTVKSGDLIVIYRTKAENGSAWFTSVATSICVVEELKLLREFTNVQEFLDYCSVYSVFTEKELLDFWRERSSVYVVKMTYNVALRRKLNRQRLVEEVGLDGKRYWGYFPLSDQEFEQILIKGEVYESLIID